MKSVSLSKALLCGLVLAVLAAGCGPDVTPDDDTPQPDVGLTKEEVVAKINANNSQIDSAIYFMKAVITSPRYPNGQGCDLTIIYQKPDKLMVKLTVFGGPALLRLKTDGEYIDILDTFDTEKPMGRIAKIERLRQLPGDVATFEPGFIAKAVGADILDPAKVTMERVEEAYVLNIVEPGDRIRRLTVDDKTFLVTKQEIYKKLAGGSPTALGTLEAEVVYRKHAKAFTGDNVMLPVDIVVTVFSGQDKSVLEMKVPSIKEDNMRLNSDRRVNLATGGTWRIKNWDNAPVKELDEHGQWVDPASSNE